MRRRVERLIEERLDVLVSSLNAFLNDTVFNWEVQTHAPSSVHPYWVAILILIGRKDE